MFPRQDTKEIKDDATDAAASKPARNPLFRYCCCYNPHQHLCSLISLLLLLLLLGVRTV